MGISNIIFFIFKKDKTFNFSFLDVFVLVFTISVFITTWINKDFLANGNRLTIFGSLILFYFSLRIRWANFTFCRQEQHLLSIFLICTGFIETLWGSAQLYGLIDSKHVFFKITGSFFNPGPYSGYLAVIFPLSLYYYLFTELTDANRTKQRASFFLKSFSALTCILIILILPVAMSRASWLALIGGSIIILWAYLYKKYVWKNLYVKYKKKIWIFLSVILVVAILGLIGVYLLKKDSADGRILIWKIPISMIKDYPLGVGLGNFSGAYGEAQGNYMASGKASAMEEYVAGSPEYAFNEYIQLFIEVGIVSFILFVCILSTTLYTLYKDKNWEIMGPLIALMIFAFFSYPFNVLSFLIVLVFILAIADTTPLSQKKNYLALVTAVVFLFFFVLYRL